MRFNVKKTQEFQSLGCGGTHAAHFMGTCESCGSYVYSESHQGPNHCGDQWGDAPDPRGVFGPKHSYAPLRASEHGNAGPDLILCFDCANDGDKYRATIAAAHSTGKWTERKPEDPIKALHIEGRRWFQRTYGNTYHSVRIWIDGKHVAFLPYQYGYGEQWLQTALDWLRANNWIPQGQNYGTMYLRETLGGTYSVIDVDRQKEL